MRETSSAGRRIRTGLRLAGAGVIAGIATLSMAAVTAPVASASSFTVTNCNDSGTGSLRAEVTAAPSGSTIAFAPAVATCSPIVLVSTITLGKNVIIQGPGAGTVAVSGNNKVGVFVVNTGVQVSISGLTIENGYANDGCSEDCSNTGGGIANNGFLTVYNSEITGNVANMGCTAYCGSSGGGIGNNGTLTVFNSLIYNNEASASCAYNCSPTGGGIQNNESLTVVDTTLSANFTTNGCGESCASSGGGIDNGGTATVSASMLTGNYSDIDCGGPCGADGGGIYNTGALTVTNSTLFANSANVGCEFFCGASGGAIDNEATLTLTSSTLSTNSVSAGCTAYCGGGGAALENDGTAKVGATIFANSDTYGGECEGSPTDLGFNISDDGTCDFTSASSVSNSGTLDATIGSPANNGGPTYTMALETGSPAIGVVTNASQCPAFDQRGVPRSVPCDIGAYDATYVSNFSGPNCPAGTFSYSLVTTESDGNFLGLFCVNTAGTGTYTQYSLPNFIQTAAGTGTVGISGTTITFSATGTKLSMLAEFTPTYTTLTETQPVPMRTVPFALT